MDSVDILASKLQSFITEKDSRKPKPYDTSATVTRVDGDTLWVHIPGGVEETPVKKTINAIPGDSVRVHVENGGAWTIGNSSAPPTDDRQANVAMNCAVKADDKAETALSAIDGLDTRITAADSRLTVVEGNITNLEGRVDVAETALDEVEGDISTLQTDVATAKGNITTLQTDISTAQGDITTIQGDITTLKTDVSEAQDDIDDTLKGLALAENVIGTLAWLSSHSKVTTDTTPTAGKSYYIRHQDGTFELVQDTTGKDPAAEGWYEMDDAISNYVGAHLSLTTYGLNLVLDNSSYKIHIGKLTATGKDGVYIIDGDGNVVSFFGENINFAADHPQYIGNSNAFIAFDPTGNDGQWSLIIGGSSIQMGAKSLEEILGKTLIYDHTYEYVRDSDNKPVQAIFTAFLYRGGVDVKTEYPAEDFTWYLKKEDKETGAIVEELKGAGYTFTVNLSECGYGAEIIGKFTIEDDATALDTDGNTLTDDENNPISVRATGESVRVRDLTVSTTIFPTDKLMIVGAENEHLVTMQTLQDYLNVNLNKQVLFNTTAAWDAQVQLTSEANTLYVYTDHQYDSQGNKIAGIKVGDGNAYLIDMPFTDEVIMEHINDNVRHITAEERAFWNNKVSCYLADTDRVIFTTT